MTATATILKFSISSKDLFNALKRLKPFFPTSPVLPILDGVLIRAENNKLILRVCDLEVTASAEVAANVQEMYDVDGYVMPFKEIYDFLKALPQQPITLTFEEESGELISAYGKYEFMVQSGAHYPEGAEVDPTGDFVIESHILSDAVTKTIWCASDDELRPAMTGAYFLKEYDRLTLVCTDAHQLAQHTTRFDEEGADFEPVIIPAKSLKQVAKAMKGEVTIQIGEKDVEFRCDDFSVTVRLIDAKYPDYKSIIPKTNSGILRVDRRDLIGTVDRVLNFSNRTTHQLIFELTKDGVGVTGESLEKGCNGAEHVAADYDGEDLTIGFNGKLLMGSLSVLEEEEIELKLTDSTHAGVVTEYIDQSDLKVILMPVALS